MEESIVPETPVIIERDGDRIKVESNFRDRDLVTRVPGAAWDRQDRVWRTRLSWAACVQLRGVFGPRLSVGPELDAWSRHEYETRVEPCLRYREAADVPENKDPDLYPRQKAGVEFLVHAKQALLGDEVGAGKTRQIIKALERFESEGVPAYPTLIIAKKSAKDSWAEEFEKVAPHRTVVVVTGSAKKRREQLEQPADVYIVHKELLRYHSRLAGYGYIKLSDEEKEHKELNSLPFKSIAADEAHYMQDPKSKQTRATWALGDQLGPDGIRFAITGTPVTRAIDSSWPLLRFIAPNEFPSKSKFIDRYALQTWSPFGFTEISGLLPESKDEFFKILDPRFIRRPTKVVVPYLPEPIRMPARKVELTGKQKKAYTQMRDNLMAEVEGGILMTKNPLAQLGRLRQLAAAYGEMQDGTSELLLTEPSAVIDELVDVIEELGDTQFIFFSESRKLMELASQRLAKEAVNHALITGMVPEADRTERRRAFQAGKLHGLGLTMGAGGESLTLTGAKAMIFIERSPSLVKNIQAEGRAVRPGQDERVMIIDIIPTLGADKNGVEIPTIYHHIHDIVVNKKQNMEEVVRDQETIRKMLGKEL